MASSNSSAAGRARLLVIEPVLRDSTAAERSAVNSTVQQPSGWGSSLTRMLSVGGANDALETGEAADRKQLTGWRLSTVDARTPAAMLDVLLRRSSWAAAFELCTTYSLPGEAVYRARWLAEPVSLRGLQTDLSQVSDRRWALDQLVQRTAPDEATQRGLLQAALIATAGRYSAVSLAEAGADAPEAAAAEGSSDSAVEDGEDGQWWLCTRLEALQRLDRLDTLLALFDG